MVEKRKISKSKPSTKFLDGLRGIAAVYVLFCHARWLLTESAEYRWKQNKVESWLIRNLTDTLLKYSHQAVIFFFVLSGFVIHVSVLKNSKLNNGKVDWKTYYIKRFNIIYPPFIFALFLTLFIDLIGRFIFKFTIYNVGSNYSIFPLKTFGYSFRDFIGNILNIQVIVKQISAFGSDYALWSLSYEWWFYLLYPLFYYMNKKWVILTCILQILLFITTQCLFEDKFIPIFTPIFQKMVIWWMGVLLAEIYLGNIRVSLKVLSLLMLFFPVALHYFDMTKYQDFFLGLGYIGLLSFFLVLPDTNFIKIIVEKLNVVGMVSYTLYACHLPILHFFHGFLIDENMGSLPSGYIWMLSIPTLILLLVLFIGKKIETIKFFNY